MLGTGTPSCWTHCREDRAELRSCLWSFWREGPVPREAEGGEPGRMLVVVLSTGRLEAHVREACGLET